MEQKSKDGDNNIEETGNKNITSIETVNKEQIISKKVSSIVPSKIVNEKPVVLSSEDLAILDYTDFSTPARMLELGKVLSKSNLVPLKKAEDIVSALMLGKELGLPFITSVTQIYPINGRPTLGVHIQKALLLTNGVIFEKIEDAVSIYSFIVKTDKGVITTEGTIDKEPKDSLKKVINTRTTYLFTREIKMPSGKYREITAKGSFSLKEASEAELMEKDVWNRYWRRMLDARAFTIGAREIADDILLGIYSPNELSSDFYVNEKGEEVHNTIILNTEKNK